MAKKKIENKKKDINTKISEWQKEAKKDIQETEQEINVEIPKQAEFFKTPVRVGNIPVDVNPLGFDSEQQYRKIYPKISLPFQTLERISFGHSDLKPNQLIFGDNLHVMRMLPSNSIDLIYIDPPFFSGRNYNIVFGDQNEIRSFTDIWEGGMPGYLIWLNARLLEMKRLLKPTGSICVHLDWHASHYVKTEMDKIFGYDNFRNEIIWLRTNDTGAFKAKSKQYSINHDVILFYSKSDSNYFKPQKKPYDEEFYKKFKWDDNDGKGKYYWADLAKPSQNSIKRLLDIGEAKQRASGKWSYKRYLNKIGEGVAYHDIWTDIFRVSSPEYPTQKPESLLQRLVLSLTNPNDLVADFFVGGGTTAAVAQKLGRRWIASDISKVAVSVTRDRILRDITGKNGKKEIQQTIEKTPDIEIKSWGIYEVPELVRLDEESFKNFIISAYNGRLSSTKGMIHGYKQSVPIFVGEPSQENPITEKEVVEFAKYIIKTGNYHQGIMIGWGFTPRAKNVAQQLESQHSVAIDFVKLQLIPIESKEFKEHIISKHPEYTNLLKFILPPEVRISHKRIEEAEYEFDVSESVSLNPSGRIINVQWDFSYNGERFISTPGYSFLGMKNNKPVLKTSYKFDSKGIKKIACKVQDDEGGEKMEIIEIDVK